MNFKNWIEFDASQVGTLGGSPHSFPIEKGEVDDNLFTPDAAQIEQLIKCLQSGMMFWALNRSSREAVFHTAFVKAVRSMPKNITNSGEPDKQMLVWIARYLRMNYQDIQKLADDHRHILRHISSQMTAA